MPAKIAQNMWQTHHGVKINKDEDQELISEEQGRREIREAVMVTKGPPGWSSPSGRVLEQEQ